jgi:hypothetical protein
LFPIHGRRFNFGVLAAAGRSEFKLIDVVFGKDRGRPEQEDLGGGIVFDRLRQARDFVAFAEWLSIDQLFAGPDRQITEVARIPKDTEPECTAF